ncbi:hypothetical protein LCGC14_1816680 [marine sediment metagenome]|uniref:Uncharacterized protein n=1 Tax=marine sediment metagenome TaxID=412755 RepID=A0A0F9IZY1_9ZZZZ
MVAEDHEAALAKAWRDYQDILRPHVFGEPPAQELHKARRRVEAAARADVLQVDVSLEKLRDAVLDNELKHADGCARYTCAYNCKYDTTLLDRFEAAHRAAVRAEVEGALRGLVERWDECLPSIMGAESMARIHGWSYDGPEGGMRPALNVARALLDEAAPGA